MFKRLAVSLALFGSFACADEEKSEVIVLTDENFEQTMKDNERVVVKFYAPWCGHCKALAPEWDKAAAKLKELESSTKLAKLDCTEEKDIAARYGVKGYPSLKYFVGGDLENPQEYSGGRTEDTIVSWVQSREMPPVSELDSDEALAQFVEKHDLALIAVTTDEARIEVLQTLAEKLRDVLPSALLRGDANKLSLYRNFEGEEPELVFDGEFNEDAIHDFVKAGRFPLFGEISQQNFQGYMQRNLPIAWVALDVADEEAFAKIKAAVVDSGAAKAVSGKASIAWINNEKFARHVENIGISSVPGMIVIHEQEKWKFDGDMTSADEVSLFFEQWSEGTLPKFLKSDPIPEDPLDEGVYVLVGKSFPDVVNSDKDVFVEFYAPWCGHCKKLAPDYVKVAAAFEKVDDVVIAKIDATANDTPEPVQGFPTLIFYPKGKGAGEGTKYEGARTAKAIVDYIEENSAADTASVDKQEL